MEGVGVPAVSFDPAVKEVLDAMLLENIEVEPGKAFGLPAYYVSGKMFAAVYEGGATIKVPEELVAELLERDGISRFRPMGRHAMKSWVLIEREDPQDLRRDAGLFQAAFEHVYHLAREQNAAAGGKKTKK